MQLSDGRAATVLDEGVGLESAPPATLAIAKRSTADAAASPPSELVESKRRKGDTNPILKKLEVLGVYDQMGGTSVERQLFLMTHAPETLRDHTRKKGRNCTTMEHRECSSPHPQMEEDLQVSTLARHYSILPGRQRRLERSA